MHRLPKDFFTRDVLEVAPALLGKRLCRAFPDGSVKSFIITETEAYQGINDLACHASKGRTPRTEVMFQEGGILYMYLIYGMYWMMNIVTGSIDEPQAVLIRGIENYNGPGKLTKALQLDKSFNYENLSLSETIWIEPGLENISYITAPRVGIDYAGEYWKNVEWRYILSITND